jgi:hypothetical protein
MISSGCSDLHFPQVNFASSQFTVKADLADVRATDIETVISTKGV